MKSEKLTNTSELPFEETDQKAAKYVIYSQEQAFGHMTQRRAEKEQLLYAITDDVLFYVWDACHLSIDQEFREEYLPFLPHVFDLLLSTKDGLELYDYLVFIEEIKFGAYKGDLLVRRRASRIVDLLLEYRSAIFNNETAVFENPHSDADGVLELYPA